jgi:MoxR-like ATPase
MEAFSRAGGRFRGFFDELNGAFLEREDVLAQTALALLSREHLLITGPPGTAKSQLARAVLGRIIDATTGEPSLFARQFTENTVLTDLVGAIDFKTLMETGRSEHFTDEGIIGSVHAFLDEVFDGRDMLLRSTLNLLGERELKQGLRTTRGRVECSLMTSNRYLTEVLDESRETLLAFVDRIAFVGFVPKGFSSPKPMQQVMRQNVAGRPPALRAYLSIQDLDVLQDAAQHVYVSVEASHRLVAFLDLFEAEMQAAVRAIPDFSPSRYLSIRSRVRAGRILKAIVTYRKIFEDPARPSEVVLSDFHYLRLVLLQAGPPPALLDQLGQEQDAREARQLKIIKTERDVFERSLGRLDQRAWASSSAAAEPLDLSQAASQPIAALMALLERTVSHPLSQPAQVQQLSRLIMQRVIEHGLGSSGAGERNALKELGEAVEALRGPLDPLTQWLQSRSLRLLEAAVEQQLLAVEALGQVSLTGVAAVERLGDVLEQMQAFQAEADELRARQPRLPQTRLEALMLSMAGAVTNRLREALHREVMGALATSDEASAAHRFKPLLVALDGFEAAAHETHPAFEALLRDVGAELFWPVSERTLAPLAGVSRADYLSTFDLLWSELSATHLARHVPFDRLLHRALHHAAEHDRVAFSKAELPADGSFSARTYDAFRRAMPRASLSYLGVQLCLRVDGASIVEFAGKPELATFGRRLSALPAALRESLWRLDLQRVSLTLSFFQRWLAQAESNQEAADAFGMLHVLTEDEALARLRVETELIEALFPEAGDECRKLRGSLEGLTPALSRAAALPVTGV